MKKINLLFALTFIASCVFAQEGLVSKKGEPILPEKGDWSISIDATPFLKYAGNFIGSNGLNTAPSFDFLSGNQTILGKYYIDQSKAYRVGLRLGLGSNSTTNSVYAIPSTSPTTFVDDVSKRSFTNIGLTAGMEWRKGKTRLQGFYGAEAGLSLSSTNTSTIYGNRLSVANQGTRIIESNSGVGFGFGLRAFIGAEYFIFPKIAIGGEFGWGLALRTTGESTFKIESWNTNLVTTSTVPNGGSSSFSVDSENLSSIFGPAGTIRLTLHF